MDYPDDNRNDDNELVVGYFNSSLSQKELERLKRWLKENKTNQRHFDEYREIWLSGKLNRAQKEFSSKAAFGRFKYNIRNMKGHPGSMYRSISFWARVAAILVVGYLAGIWSHPGFLEDTPPSSSFEEIIVPAGSKTKVSLPDGTTVWLNSDSKLTVADRFNAKKREVNLEGEGYFKVKTNPDKPFIVATSGMNVIAFGTAFNVKAYPDERTITATLEEGIVVVEGTKTTGHLFKRLGRVRLYSTQSDSSRETVSVRPCLKWSTK